MPLDLFIRKVTVLYTQDSKRSWFIAVLEITVGHWPFSDQFQHLADQNLF